MTETTENSPKQYLLFPGCVIQNRIPFIEKSARYVFEKLNVLVQDAPFGCCPDPIGVQSTDRQTWLTLGARNLAIAEEANKNIISLCNGCTETLKTVKYDLSQHEHEREEINQRLGKINKKYEGTVQIYHFVQTLIEQVGLDTIKSMVKKPLTGLKIAPHSGCHYSRPHQIMEWDDPMKPKWLEELLITLGAESVPYEELTLCCGSGVARNNPDASAGIMKRKFESILNAEAKAIAVICPSCFQQLEAGQRTVKKVYNMDFVLPVFYITELMALAFGATVDELGVKFHSIKATEFLKTFGIE